MKNLMVILIIATVAGLLYFFVLNPSPRPSSSPIRTKETVTTVPSQETTGKLPEVIVLFQKGDGESDLALFVIGEMEKQSSHLANFKKVDVASDPEVAAFYGMSSIPAVIIKAANGRVLVKHEGYLDKESILNALKLSGKN